MKERKSLELMHFYIQTEWSKQNLKDTITRHKVKINPMVVCLVFPNTWQ